MWLPWSQCQCLCQTHYCGVWTHVCKKLLMKKISLDILSSKLWLLYISVWCQLLDHIFSTRSNFEYNEHTVFLQNKSDYLDSTLRLCFLPRQNLNLDGLALRDKSLLIRCHSNINIVNNCSGCYRSKTTAIAGWHQGNCCTCLGKKGYTARARAIGGSIQRSMIFTFSYGNRIRNYFVSILLGIDPQEDDIGVESTLSPRL